MAHKDTRHEPPTPRPAHLSDAACLLARRMDHGGKTMSQLRHQLEMDVERLRKSADRIEQIVAECRALDRDRTIAVQALKIIATWAAFMFDKDAKQIKARALDTLRLMGEKACE